MPDAARRRNVIRKLIAQQKIATQGGLVRLLSKEGLKATQASVSRDVAALGLIKAGGFYSLPGAAPASGGPETRFDERIHRIRKAGDNLIIVLTDPGGAQSVGRSLDAARWPSIAGTVAGDDTIFIACDGKTQQKKTLQALREIVPEAFI